MPQYYTIVESTFPRNSPYSRISFSTGENLYRMENFLLCSVTTSSSSKPSLQILPYESLFLLSISPWFYDYWCNMPHSNVSNNMMLLYNFLFYNTFFFLPPGHLKWNLDQTPYRHSQSYTHPGKTATAIGAEILEVLRVQLKAELYFLFKETLGLCLYSCNKRKYVL